MAGSPGGREPCPDARIPQKRGFRAHEVPIGFREVCAERVAIRRRPPDRDPIRPALATTPLPESSSNLGDRSLREPAPATTEFAKKVAAYLVEKHASGVAILDVSGPLAIVDYFVLATVTNTRQAQALARELDLEVKHSRGQRKRNQGGMETEDSNWVLLDFDDVVVHLFLPEAREYYGLEGLWADAPRLAVPEASTPSPEADSPAAEARPERPGRTQFQVFPTPDEPEGSDSDESN